MAILIKLEPELEWMLGLTGRDTFYKTATYHETHQVVDIRQDVIKGTQSAFNCYGLNAGIHALYLYSNIVEPQFVGNTYAQLLATVAIPSTLKFGEQCVERYDTPFYIPIAGNCFQTVEVSLRDDTSHLNPFKFGRTIVVLHFINND